ncbi:conserved hypothetical protein [Ricinus communis]|uniref:Uncharacterized protein n=1 Tax=Ricinus communis TaxID=3988 RepID=B9RM45_RICCO|nr:conserved hypothetical protein [Ricinus communis]
MIKINTKNKERELPSGFPVLRDLEGKSKEEEEEERKEAVDVVVNKSLIVAKAVDISD